MKNVVFRASEQVESALGALEVKLERNRADILRRAVLEYARINGIEVPA